MEKLSEQTKQIMNGRFSEKDNIIAVATEENGIPHVRNVNAIYEDGAFYSITNTLSNKMRQMEKNPNVAVAGDWFTGHGLGVNLGYIGNDENAVLAEKMRRLFSAWIENGHTDFENKNTCILCIKLTDGILHSGGVRYSIDFKAEVDCNTGQTSAWKKK